MVIYEVIVSYANIHGSEPIVTVEYWDSEEHAFKYLKACTEVDECMYASVGYIESDGAGHFGASGYDLIAEYTAGIGFEFFE